jgi:hypothetical protein
MTHPREGGDGLSSWPASSDMLKHIDGGLLLSPDVQYINNPAKDTGHDNVWALSLRATMWF